MGKGVGTTIGRVNVKVFPDTSDFRKRLEDQLESIERGLLVTIETELDTSKLDDKARAAVAAINAKNHKVEFKTDLDSKGLTRQADEVQRQIQKSAKDQKLKLSYDPSTFSSVQQALAQVDRALDDLRAVKLEVDLDEASLEKAKAKLNKERLTADLGIRYDPDDIEDVRRALKQLDSIAQEERKVPLEVNLQNIDHVRQQLSDLVNDYDEQDIDFDAHANTLLARAELARVARDRVVNLFVNVDRAALAKAQTALAALSGGRLIGATLDNLRSLFQNLDKNIPLIGSVVLAVQGLSSWLLAAASNGFALARSLAQMAGAGLALPGILGGVAVGVAAYVAVLKDFNDVLPSVGERFSDLQDLMSIRFWAVAKQPIEDLVERLMPRLNADLGATASALAVWTSAFSNAIDNRLLDSLEPMFKNLNDSIGISAAFADEFAGIIEILGRRGSEYLPRLASWVGEIGTRFEEWLRLADQDGRLTGWIETGIRQMKEFGRVLRGVGSILSGLGRAAENAGGSTLGMLADTLDRVAKVVNGANFQTNLTTALLGAHDAMGLIADKSGPQVEELFERLALTMSDGFRIAGSAIGNLLGSAASALSSDEFQGGLLNLLKGLERGIAGLVPSFGPLGAALGTVGTVIGELATNFGPLLAKVLTLISELALRAGPDIIQVSESLTNLLSTGLDIVGPIIVDIAAAFTQLAASIPAPVLILGFVSAWAALRAGILAFNIYKNFDDIKRATLGIVGAFQRFRGAAPQMNVSLGTIGKAAGVVAAALLAIQAIGFLTSSSGDASITRVEEFATAMTGLANEVEVAEERLLNLGTAAQLDSLFASDIGGLLGFAGDIGGLDDVFRFQGMSQFQKGILGIADAINLVQDPVKLTSESISNFDTALANLVASGNADDAAEGFARFAEVGQRNGWSLERVNELLPNYNDALLAVARTAEEEADAVADATARQLAYNDAVLAMTGLTPGQIASINDASKAFIDFSKGLDEEAMPSLEEWISGLEKQIEAQTRWADNLSTLFQNFNLSDALQNELIALGPAGAAMIQSLVDLGPQAVDALNRLEVAAAAKAAGAASVIGSKFSNMSIAAQQAIAGLPADVQAELASQIPTLQGVGSGAAQAIATGFDAYPLDDVVVEVIDGVVTATINMDPELHFGTAGTGAAQAYGEGLTNAAGEVEGAAEGVVTAAEEAVDNGVQMAQAGRDSVNALGQGMTQNRAAAVNAMNGVVRAAMAAASQPTNWRMVGSLAVAGLAQGIYGNSSVARSAGAAAGRAALAGAEAALDVNSPSREMAKVGVWAVLGLAEGLRDYAPAVKAGAQLGQAVLGAVDDANIDAFALGAQTGAGYADGIESMAKRSQEAMSSLRDDLNEVTAKGGKGLTARVDVARSSEPLTVSLDGAEMTLMIDGQPVRGIIRAEITQSNHNQDRDFRGRRGGR